MIIRSTNRKILKIKRTVTACYSNHFIHVAFIQENKIPGHYVKAKRNKDNINKGQRRGGGGGKRRRRRRKACLSRTSVLTELHPGVPYQGCVGTGINKGKSLLANHTEDGDTCADDLQQNKRTFRIITINSEDILRIWKDYLDIRLRCKNATLK